MKTVSICGGYVVTYSVWNRSAEGVHDLMEEDIWKEVCRFIDPVDGFRYERLIWDSLSMLYDNFNFDGALLRIE